MHDYDTHVTTSHTRLCRKFEQFAECGLEASPLIAGHYPGYIHNIAPPAASKKKKKITINLDNPLMFQAGDMIQCEKDVQVLRNNGVFIKTWHFKMLKTSIEGLNAVLGSRELTLHAADRLAKGVPFLCCPEWKLSQNSTSRSTISHGHLMLDCTPRQIHKMKRRARTEPSHIIRSA